MSNGNWGGPPNGGNPVYRYLTLNGDPPIAPPGAAQMQQSPAPSRALAAPPGASSPSPDPTYCLVPSQYRPATPLSDPSSPALVVNIWADGTQPWLNTGAVLPPWSKYAVDPSMSVYDFCTRVGMPMNERSWHEGWGVVEVFLVGPDGSGLPRFEKGRVWKAWQDCGRKVQEMARGGDGEVWLAVWAG